MDRNYLERRMEEELARAAGATSSEARGSHEELAERYQQQIKENFPDSAAA